MNTDVPGESDRTSPQVQVRPLQTVEEFDAAVALQVAVWGYADGDVIPRRVFIVASHIGGQVLGALVDGVLAGFAMALPGVRGGEPYLHSHMLAVLPEYRDQRLGRRLKLAQRAEALERGIRWMEWTFDPMEIKNAYFNLHRLAAVCGRYEPNFYGGSSSPLQGGLPTDRLVARWDLGSARVERAIAGERSEDAVRERVAVPARVAEWKGSEATRGEALGAQAEVRTALQGAFAQGMLAVDYAVDAQGNGSYLMATAE